MLIPNLFKYTLFYYDKYCLIIIISIVYTYFIHVILVNSIHPLV